MNRSRLVHSLVIGAAGVATMLVGGCADRDLDAPVARQAASVSSTCSGSQYRVHVAVDEVRGVTNDLLGVNKGPLSLPSSCTVHEANRYDYTAIYQRIGVRSVRLHDDTVNVSSIFTAGTGSITDEVGGGRCGSEHPIPPCPGGFYERVPDTSPCRLQWDPPESGLDDASNYDFRAADRQYRAVLAGGFDAYLRLGENAYGPSYTSAPTGWAQIAAQIADHFHGGFANDGPAFGRPPSQIEWFNEPDLGGWTGNAAGFISLYDGARAEVGELGLTTPQGGAGFSNGGVFGASGVSEFVGSILESEGTDLGDFASIHYYPSITGDSATLPSHVVGDLRRARDNLGHFSVPSDLYLSEWNIALAAHDSDCGDPDPFGASCVFTQGVMSSFVSGMLTWLQDPDLGFIGAHFYAGGRTGMALAMHSDHAVEFPTGSALGAEAPAFNLRPSALAMSMHTDLRARPLLRTTMGRYHPASSPTADCDYVSVLQAASVDWPVTAVSAGTDGEHATISVVITNLSAAPHDVEVIVHGTTCTSVAASTLDVPSDGGITIAAIQSGGVFVPESTQLESAFSTHLTSSAPACVATGPSRWLVQYGSLAGHSIVRLEITP